jgi:YidC/Oxa1 family membrane protein insertase
MDTQRLVALIVFSFSSLLLWDAWQKHNAPKPPASPGQAQLASPSKSDSSTSGLPVPSTSLAAPSPEKSVEGSQSVPAPSTAMADESNAGVIVVRTDTLEVEIGRKGGDIQRVTLLKHFAATDRTKPLTLMQPKDGHYFVTQTGLLGGLPNHNSLWKASADRFELKSGESALEVRLTAAGRVDVDAQKIYRFKPGSYVVELAQEVRNSSEKAIAPSAYFQFVRDGNPPEGEAAQNNPMTGVATFTGPAVYTNEKKFVKVAFSDVDKGKQEHPVKASDGWLALVQHYFVSAWLPKPGVEREYFTRKVDKVYSAGIIQNAGSIAPGQSGAITMSLYVGPQTQDSLKSLAPGLDLVVDYGWLTILAAPLFWVLQFIHSFVGNWGWSIVLLTILIKAVFYPLNQKAGMSMAHMKAVAPRIQQLQQRYGDDRAKLNQAMMELYRTEKINPLGGCLPILIQIPVFIALYWVLLAAVELRHAPWVGWITDLSVPDPYYILPLVMAVSMFVQTKLNPPPPDPVQAKIMLFMPLIFSIFFFFFPAGLVLYWTVQNLIGIAQQWWINKTVEKQALQKNAGKR